MRSSVLGLMLVRLVLGASLATVTGCSKDDPTFALLAASNVFNQSMSVDTKIDVLFVIDNSGSMATAQSNLTTNFNAFISSFITKGYDFHIGVITSDTWRGFNGGVGWGVAYARLKDGVGASHSGVFVIDPATPNQQQTFLTNASVGITGLADERVFQSFKTALESPLNADFRRPGAFLAIVGVSDEDDFSASVTSDINENYNNVNIRPISYFTDFLDNLTQSTAASKKYSFSSIHVLNAACLAASHAAANIGYRYSALVAATQGVEGSICAPDFSTELDNIQKGILVLASQFYLPRVPVVSTIQVVVNGAVVPNNPTTGWSYDAAANSIVFSYAAVPPQGATIVINYDPVTVL